MPLPVIERQDFIAHVTALIDAIDSGGGEYRHTAKRVINDLRTVTQVDRSHTPWAAVIGGNGSGSSQLSGVTGDEMDIVVRGVMRRDESRWPGKSAAHLIEEWIADVEKAMDADTSLGGSGSKAVGFTRRTNVFHDPEGAFSFFHMVTTYRFKRRRNLGG